MGERLLWSESAVHIFDEKLLKEIQRQGRDVRESLAREVSLFRQDHVVDSVRVGAIERRAA
jgi:hypothetical protein